MNSKHIAVLFIGFVIVCLVQGTMSMQGFLRKRQTEATVQQQMADSIEAQKTRENLQLAEFTRTSQELVDYLKKWEPYFNEVNSAQRAELNVSLRIKEDRLVSLSQRYEIVSLAGNASISRVLRTYATFEDDYSRLLNWLGRVEQQLPTSRLDSVQISKGTAANDLRVVLVLDQPLISTK